MSTLTADQAGWLDRALAAESDARFHDQARPARIVGGSGLGACAASPENRLVLTLVILKVVRLARRPICWAGAWSM